MSALEIGLIGILALWALGSGLFLLRIPGLHPVLRRIGHTLLFMHWSLFSPSDRSMRAGTMELSYRDRRADGTISPWRVGALGHCWAWRAAFWLPQRYLATAIQNYGRDVRSEVKREAPVRGAGRVPARIIAEFVDRRDPPAAGATREYRLVRRFASDGTAEELLDFRTGAHDLDA